MINDWDDMTTMYHMQSKLSGMARTWYHNLSSVDYTWDEWKRQIMKTFPDHVDYSKSLRRMLERQKRKNETMTSYYFGKMELLRTCQITGKNAVSCLIDGIPDITIQNAARAGRYVVPEALFEEYLSMLRDEHSYEEECVRVLSLENLPQRSELRNSVNPKRYSSSHKKLELTNVTCFNCKKKGHFQSKCIMPRRECARCHLLEHDADNCTIGFGKSKDSNKKGERMLVLDSVADQNLTTCYFIDCVINGHPLRGYVDSGCSVVTLRQSVVDNLKLETYTTNVRLCGYAGGSVVATSKVTLKLDVDLASATVEAIVVPDYVQNVSVLVGQPFINNENVTMVVRGNQVRLFNKNIFTFDNIIDSPKRKINLYVSEKSVISAKLHRASRGL
ncbi:uncharacterized protein LOC123317860 [Coccinella septempunctata]|uniref:uncharacterized protein LOC123317860 n=1 Tax=Coccinella septempunctata TaxID=41139 RepID=UPI001D07B35A|nr:uncharacterized protein LOC123317860 [Coccinella septempunctata]